MNLDEKIKQHIPQDELLAQLAEGMCRSYHRGH